MTRGPDRKIIDIDGEAGGAGLISLLYQAKTMDWPDSSLLAAISGLNERDTPRPSKLEAVAGIVADQMLAEGIDGGVDTALATSRLILRNIKSVEGGDSLADKSGTINEGTLVAARARLIYAGGPYAKVNRGIELGDRAIHFRAGVGSRHLKRAMVPSELRAYTRALAMQGYGSALENARRVQAPGLEEEVRLKVEALIMRFDEAAEILSLLLESRKVKIRRLMLN